jgi:hypothetical protein
MHRAKVGNVVHVAVVDRTVQAAKLLQTMPGVSKVSITDAPMGTQGVSANGNGAMAGGGAGDGRIINVHFDADAKTDVSDVPNLLVNNGFRLLTFTEEAVNLETAFMRLTKGAVQ